MSEKSEKPSGAGSKMSLEEYKREVGKYLIEKLNVSPEVAAGLIRDYEPWFPGFLRDGWSIAMAATYIIHNY